MFLKSLLILAVIAAHARDLDGTHAGDPLHAWFDSLASGKGLCCSFADGKPVAVDDWGTHDDHYWVIIDGMRYAVPPEALVTGPNKYGPAVVWPYEEDGEVKIRCFMPGTLS